MALIKCPECNKEISDKSKACVHCGFPLEEHITTATKCIENAKTPQTDISISEQIITNSLSKESQTTTDTKVILEEIKETVPQDRKESNYTPQPLRKKNSLIPFLMIIIIGALSWLAYRYLIILPQEYSKAEQLLNKRQYSKAISAFEKLGNYSNAQSDMKYATALEAYYGKNYEIALTYFEELDDYRDSKAYFQSIIYKPVYSQKTSGKKQYDVDWSYDSNGNITYYVISSGKETVGKDRGKTIWQLRRTYKYDAQGNIISKTEQNYAYEELTTSSTYSYTYDYNNNGTIKEQQCTYISDRKKKYSTSTYEYDENKRIVWEHQRGNSSNSDTHYEYNWLGLISKKTYTDERGYIEIYQYYYDKYGNITNETYSYGWDKDDLHRDTSSYSHKKYKIIGVKKPVL